MMTSEAEIEAAAKVIYWHFSKLWGGTWEDATDAERDGYCSLARAVIEAAKLVRHQAAVAPSPTLPLGHPDVGN